MKNYFCKLVKLDSKELGDNQTKVMEGILL